MDSEEWSDLSKLDWDLLNKWNFALEKSQKSSMEGDLELGTHHGSFHWEMQAPGLQADRQVLAS